LSLFSGIEVEVRVLFSLVTMEFKDENFTLDATTNAFGALVEAIITVRIHPDRVSFFIVTSIISSYFFNCDEGEDFFRGVFTEYEVVPSWSVSIH
jgi:hypothetical protein